MARPEKTGHDYFPFYTHSNDTQLLQTILSQKGPVGYVTVLQLDRLIIGGEGYYADTNDLTISALHHSCAGMKLEDIKDALEYAIDLGYYDKDMVDKKGIFTNKDIQKNHLFNSQRRTGFMVKKEFFLLSNDEVKSLKLKRKLTKDGKFLIWEPINVSNNTLNVSENDTSNGINVNNNYSTSEINASNNTEIKINKIKENKIKENESKLNGISNSKSNSDSKSKNNNNLINNHVVVQQLINSEFLNPTDNLLEIQNLNSFCFELNKLYGFNDICTAGRNVMRTLKERNKHPGDYDKDVEDFYNWFTAGMKEQLKQIKCNSQEETSDINSELKTIDSYDEAHSLGRSRAKEREVSNEAEELKRLKEARKKRKEGNSK